MVDRFERFSFAISEISRLWHKIASNVMEEYGLKGPYAVYFTAMYRSPDGITAANLSELCGRDKADVSRAIAVLEKKGLVIKESLGKSLYRARLKLTESGKQLAERINQKAVAAVSGGSKGLSKEHREIFYNSLELICANMQALSQDGL